MKSLKDFSLNIPEEDYHKYPAWSYSIIAKYAKEGFSSLATLHEPTVPTPSLEFGSLFDSIITKGLDSMDEYYISSTTIPNGEKKALDYMLSQTDTHFSDLTPDFVMSCCDACQYQPTWGYQAKMKHLSPYEEYYEAKLSGKKVVSQQDWDDASEMAKIFRNDEYLKGLFGTKDTDNVEYLYQTQFCIPYTTEDGTVVKIKIMPDLLVVNHKERIIQPVDLKTSSIPAWGFKENFIKFRYDIQASLYTDVLRTIMDKDEYYETFTILPYLFTDISRADKVPVTYIYNPKEESQIDGLSYTIGERVYQYKGWKALLNEILEYEKQNAKVPSYIKTDGPNDLLSIISK